MSSVLYLKDGTREIMTGDIDRFWSDLIYERLGWEAEREFKEYWDAKAKEYENAEEEMRNYERSLDGYRSELSDVCEELEFVLKMLDAPRLDKKRVKKQLSMLLVHIERSL